MHAVSEMQAKLRLKTGFAFSHLQIATRSARDAHAVEQANMGAEFGPWFDGMMRLVPVSIVMAGAALEASANELLQDILDGSTQLQLTPSRQKLLEELKDDRSGNAPMKFRRLGLLMETDPDTGTEPWHNAELLVKFRNEFMHFRPSWDDDDIHSGRFVEEVRKKIRIVDAYKSNFLFPYGFMTYDCARWAVQTVLAFSADFSKLLGVKDKFTLPGLDFTLP
jgi:hypothetical protein